MAKQCDWAFIEDVDLIVVFSEQRPVDQQVCQIKSTEDHQERDLEEGELFHKHKHCYWQESSKHKEHLEQCLALCINPILT